LTGERPGEDGFVGCKGGWWTTGLVEGLPNVTRTGVGGQTRWQKNPEMEEIVRNVAEAAAVACTAQTNHGIGFDCEPTVRHKSVLGAVSHSEDTDNPLAEDGRPLADSRDSYRLVGELARLTEHDGSVGQSFSCGSWCRRAPSESTEHSSRMHCRASYQRKGKAANLWIPALGGTVLGRS